MAGTAQGNGWSMAGRSGGTAGAAAPPRRVARPCSLLRGQAAAPTRMLCARCRGFWWERRPRRDRPGTVHPASRPGGRSCRDGMYTVPRVLVVAATPPRRGARPCSVLRGQAAAPTGRVCARPGGLGGSGGLAAMDLAPCILLRGQAAAPTGRVCARCRGFWWERRPRRDRPGTVHPASRPGGRSYQRWFRRSLRLASAWWERRPRRDGV
jgi:hypothetical protein